MRFALKFALALWIGVCLIYLVNAATRIRGEVRSFEADMRRDHVTLGRGLGPATALIWEAEGQERALAAVEQTNQSEGQISITWVDLDAPEGHPDQPAAPAGLLIPLRQGDPVSWADREGGAALHTYVPLRVDGQWRGALQFTEPLTAENAYIRASVVRVAATSLAMAVFAGVLTLFLGIRFVGRPIRQLVEKARRVGAGDFSGPLAVDQADEIGELAREMNLMSERLALARTQLETETGARIAALEQLRHGDRLMTVGQLSSGLAHELGTPLNVITQRAKMVASGEVDGEDARANARIVAEQSERITAIVRQLLDFSRRRAPEPATVDLVAVAERVALLLAPTARKIGVSLVLQDAATGVLQPLADGVQLQQVLSNLVLNAMQAMGSRGGTVTIGFAQVRQAAAAGGPERDWMVVRVKDQGPGITPDDLPKIFDPFFTTKPVGAGTGLGLSVAWGIVSEHGGWIAAANAPEGGAIFEVFLPQTETT